MIDTNRNAVVNGRIVSLEPGDCVVECPRCQHQEILLPSERTVQDWTCVECHQKFDIKTRSLNY